MKNLTFFVSNVLFFLSFPVFPPLPPHITSVCKNLQQGNLTFVGSNDSSSPPLPELPPLSFPLHMINIKYRHISL